MHVCVYTCVFIATPYMYTYTYAAYVTCGEKGPQKYPCSCLTRLHRWVYPPRAPPGARGGGSTADPESTTQLQVLYVSPTERHQDGFLECLSSDWCSANWTVLPTLWGGPPEATPTPTPQTGRRLPTDFVNKGIRTSQISTVCVNVCLI